MGFFTASCTDQINIATVVGTSSILFYFDLWKHQLTNLTSSPELIFDVTVTNI
jgi:hypothetical protein